MRNAIGSMLIVNGLILIAAGVWYAISEQSQTVEMTVSGLVLLGLWYAGSEKEK